MNKLQEEIHFSSSVEMLSDAGAYDRETCGYVTNLTIEYHDRLDKEGVKFYIWMVQMNPNPF